MGPLRNASLLIVVVQAVAAFSPGSIRYLATHPIPSSSMSSSSSSSSVVSVVVSFSSSSLPRGRHQRTSPILFVASDPTTSSSTTEGDDGDDTMGVPISINGQNIDLTQALVDHIEKRIGGPLKKLSGNDDFVRDCDVVLSVTKNPKVKNSHRVEVVTNLKGTTVICRNESPDMYNSIDMASHALNRKLLKYKERRVAGWHGGPSLSDDFLEALQEIEDEMDVVDAGVEPAYMDPEKPAITKIKSFDLSKPISLEEAVFALDYVDHDFYVFRNDETKEINVVYKRHVGGVGWIEP